MQIREETLMRFIHCSEGVVDKLWTTVQIQLLGCVCFLLLLLFFNFSGTQSHSFVYMLPMSAFSYNSRVG